MTKIEMIELPIQSKLKLEEVHCSSVLDGRLAACFDCKSREMMSAPREKYKCQIFELENCMFVNIQQGRYECLSGFRTGPEECTLTERRSRCRYMS